MIGLSKKEFLTIVLLFAVWRISLFIIAALAPLVITNFGATFPYYKELLISSHLPYYIWSLGNFDGVHYLRIAQDNYVYQYTQAFFPLYPMLINYLSYITFGNYLIAALLISNVSFLLAIILFFKLVKKYFDGKTALWSVLFLLSFPTSFYFGAVYTEGIFLLIAAFFFLLLGSGKMAQTALLAALASSLRLVGVFLAPIIFITQKTKTSAIYACLASSGLALYMAYLWIKFDSPLYFLTAQGVWGQDRTTTSFVLLPQVFYRYIKIMASASGPPLYNAIFELSTTCLAIILLFAATKKVKTEWLVFSWFAILTPTLTGTLTSMPRYILVAFPIFIVLAQIRNTPMKFILIFISAIGLAICTIIFTRGYWIA